MSAGIDDRPNIVNSLVRGVIPIVVVMILVISFGYEFSEITTTDAAGLCVLCVNGFVAWLALDKRERDHEVDRNISWTLLRSSSRNAFPQSRAKDAMGGYRSGNSGRLIPDI